MAQILIAEYNLDVRALLTRIITRAGHTALTAADATQALELAQTYIPDLIVMDAVLPMLDDWSIAHALKSDRRTNRIPVMLLTAYMSREIEQQAHDVDFADLMMKPFSIKTFMEHVTALIERSDTVGGSAK